MKCATHNGMFHADDVLAAAVLLLRFPDATIVRSRDPDTLASADIVFDVGGVYDHDAQHYDHHQRGGAKVRPNGIHYSSLGLIWDHYGRELCPNKEVWAAIDETIVQPTDAFDCGQPLYTSLTFDPISPYTLTHFIDSFNPSDGTDAEYDTAFFEAVRVAQSLITRLIAKETTRLAERDLFLAEYHSSKDPSVAILPRYIDIPDTLYESPLTYVIYPDSNGRDWMIIAVADRNGSFTPKQPFPEAWRGLRDQDLAAITGVSDALFCHATGFMCGAKSREGALRLVQQASTIDDKEHYAKDRAN